MRVIAIVLIVLGILALGYQGFSYVTQEKLVEVGPVQITTERERTVWIPPVVGGMAVVAGIVILALSTRKTA